MSVPSTCFFLADNIPNVIPIIRLFRGNSCKDVVQEESSKQQLPQIEKPNISFDAGNPPPQNLENSPLNRNAHRPRSFCTKSSRGFTTTRMPPAPVDKSACVSLLPETRM
ncbi:uncharacterized protein V6R79_020593 [Siganus canaliculatus]